MNGSTTDERLSDLRTAQKNRHREANRTHTNWGYLAYHDDAIMNAIDNLRRALEKEHAQGGPITVDRVMYLITH
jgi:hypothetical protein